MKIVEVPKKPTVVQTIMMDLLDIGGDYCVFPKYSMSPIMMQFLEGELHIWE